MGYTLNMRGHLCRAQATTWWRHQMETLSASLAFCAGTWPVSGEFPTQRPVTQSFYVFFDLCLNKRLSNQSWGWWFETPSGSLGRHCNKAIIVRRLWKSVTFFKFILMYVVVVYRKHLLVSTFYVISTIRLWCVQDESKAEDCILDQYLPE